MPLLVLSRNLITKPFELRQKIVLVSGAEIYRSSDSHIKHNWLKIGSNKYPGFPATNSSVFRRIDCPFPDLDPNPRQGKVSPNDAVIRDLKSAGFAYPTVGKDLMEDGIRRVFSMDVSKIVDAGDMGTTLEIRQERQALEHAASVTTTARTALGGPGVPLVPKLTEKRLDEFLICAPQQTAKPLVQRWFGRFQQELGMFTLPAYPWPRHVHEMEPRERLRKAYGIWRLAAGNKCTDCKRQGRERCVECVVSLVQGDVVGQMPRNWAKTMKALSGEEEFRGAEDPELIEVSDEDDSQEQGGENADQHHVEMESASVAPQASMQAVGSQDPPAGAVGEQDPLASAGAAELQDRRSFVTTTRGARRGLPAPASSSADSGAPGTTSSRTRPAGTSLFGMTSSVGPPAML